MTFGEALAEYITLSAKRWRPRTLQAWRYALQSPPGIAALRGLAVEAVETSDIVTAIRPASPYARVKILARIAAVLDWAAARGFRAGTNPARFKIADYLITPKLQVEHRRAMPWPDCPAFAQSLSENEKVSAQVLLFVILTCVRLDEACGARLEEIDSSSGTWTIAAERMKGARGHRVPLSEQATAVLRRMEASRTSDLIFEGRGGVPITGNPVRELCPGYHPHGFRSSFADWGAP
jgi:integrase